MKYLIEIAGREYEVTANNQNGKLQLNHKGKPVSFDYVKIHPAGLYSLILDGRQYRMWIETKENNIYRVRLNSRDYDVEVSDERQLLRKSVSEDQAGTGVMLVRAPIPGLILSIEVAEKQEVSMGDGLIIMEAMKMENEIKSPGNGQIRTIHVKTGDTIEKNFVLIEIDKS